MPISQTRMLAIIAAAKDYQRALNTILESIRSAQQRAEHQPPEIAARELYNLSLLANPLGLLHNPMNSPAIVMTEDRHFKSNAGRNNYARKWQAQQRGALPAGARQGSIRNTQAFAPDTPDIDPRVTTEDLARFRAQAEEDRKRDASFSLDFATTPQAPVHSPEDQAGIDADVAREMQLSEMLKKGPAKGA